MTLKQKAFYRIDVDLPCYYKVLSYEEAEESSLPDIVSGDYMREHFFDQLQLLNQDIEEQIETIEKKSTLISECLRSMNRKIDFFMQTVDEQQLSNVLPIRRVNLSANGVAMEIVGDIDPTCKVDLIMRPLKNESPVAVRCDIVHIGEQPGSSDSHWVAMKYQHINEDNRRKLIYFVQTKEIEYSKIADAQ